MNKATLIALLSITLSACGTAPVEPGPVTGLGIPPALPVEPAPKQAPTWDLAFDTTAPGRLKLSEAAYGVLFDGDLDAYGSTYLESAFIWQPGKAFSFTLEHDGAVQTYDIQFIDRGAEGLRLSFDGETLSHSFIY